MIFDDANEQEAKERTHGNIAQSRPTYFGENLEAAYTAFATNDAAGAVKNRRWEKYEQRLDLIEKETGKRPENPISRIGPHEDDMILGVRPGPNYKPVELLPGLSWAYNLFTDQDEIREAARLTRHEEEVAEVLGGKSVGMSRQEIEDELRAESQKAEKRNEDVAMMATAGGAVGQFLGSTGGAMSQPEVIATLPIGAPIRAGLLAKVGIEAAIGGTTEAFLQPGVQKQRGSQGLESGVDRAIEAIGFAAIGAGGFTGALGVIAKGGRVAYKKVFGEDPKNDDNVLSEAFEKVTGRKPNPDEAALIVATEKDLNASTPYRNRNAGTEAVRIDNETAAMEAVMQGVPVDEADLKIAPSAVRQEPDDDLTTVEIQRSSDIRSIGVDADLMQFKSGGDASGVTDRLQGVTEWSPERAGISLIYEYSDGRRIIADGHQRLGLAKRLAAQGKDVELPSIILREVDGVSPEQARARAAFKNIAEGTGKPTDAAKVLRDMGADPSEIGLPLRSALVRDAQGLASLSDEVFGMVINDVLVDRFAAIVGRLIPNDPELQKSVAGLLVKLRPVNVTEAESIVRQATQNVSRETQTSLFGDEDVATSLYLERARVLDRAIKMLRRNVSVFQTLTDEATEIASEGNVLDAAANVSRLNRDAVLREHVTSQAHMKGDISDALTKAAKAVKDGDSFANAARDFVAAVERGTKGTSDAGTGRRVGRGSAQFDDTSLPPDNRSEPDAFSDPTGDGAEGQTDQIQAEIIDLFENSDLSDVRVPISEGLDSDGGRVAETQTIREILDDLEEDQEFVEQLQLCDGRSS